MAETIGSRLRAAREAKGMSIEDVAFETRIHANFVRCLEQDDYSHFASTTYAKSFLTLYSRFLGVDAAEALHFFAGGDEIRLGGQPYLARIETLESVKAPRTTKISRDRDRPDKAKATVTIRRESPGFAPVFMGLFIFVLLAGIPVLWYLGKDAKSFDEATTKAKTLAAEAGSGTLGAEAPATMVVAENPSPAPGADTPITEPAAAGVGERRERNVAADWVLEEEKLSNSKTERPLDNAESTLDTVGTPRPTEVDDTVAPGTDPGASTTVAVAVPVESGPAPTPAPEGAQAAAPLVAIPMVDEPEIVPEPTVKPDDPVPAEAPGPPPTVEADPPASPTSTTPPLRAVPLIARPVMIPETGESDDNDNGEDEDEDDTAPAAETRGAEDDPEPAFVDPRHRFPRPLN